MNVITTDIDCSKELAEQVRKAFSEDTPLCFAGGGSKIYEGRAAEGKSLSVLGHHGIIEHAPSELVITARAGTPLADIESRLAEKNQMFRMKPVEQAHHPIQQDIVASRYYEGPFRTEMSGSIRGIDTMAFEPLLHQMPREKPFPGDLGGRKPFF